MSRAAVFHAPEEPFRLEDFPLPEPTDGAALVRISCATICGSDLHSYFGRRPAPVPSVLGHEMVGRICALGPGGVLDFDGRALAVGDRVTWSMVWTCGSCFYCQWGPKPKCERLMKFGHERIGTDGTGKGWDLVGGFAEHCLLPAGTAIFLIPDGVPDSVAAPANCATATVASVLRHAGDLTGETVVVVGAGMLGLTACAMASADGAAQIIAVETDPARREMARSFGASAVLDGCLPTTELRCQVVELTGGRGAEVVMEFSGMSEAVEAGFELLRHGGRMMLAGSTFPARGVSISAEQVVRRMIRLQGIYNYEPRDLGRALEFLASFGDRFPFVKLVGKSFPLEQVQEAFEYADRERPFRVAVLPGTG